MQRILVLGEGFAGLWSAVGLPARRVIGKPQSSPISAKVNKRHSRLRCAKDWPYMRE
jgi:hypothetical protein